MKTGGLVDRVLQAIPGRAVRLPVIQGVVVDEATGKAVGGAWVTGTVTVTAVTAEGRTERRISGIPAHTRTDSRGVFAVPAVTAQLPGLVLLKPEVGSLVIRAETADERAGEATGADLSGRDRLRLTLCVGPEMHEEPDHFYHLYSLYLYCMFGRNGGSVPAAGDGADAWEMDFTTEKYRRYLGRYREARESGYFAALDHVAKLYEKRGDLKRSAEALATRIAYMERNGYIQFAHWQREKSIAEAKLTELKGRICAA